MKLRAVLQKNCLGQNFSPQSLDISSNEFEQNVSLKILQTCLQNVNINIKSLSWLYLFQNAIVDENSWHKMTIPMEFFSMLLVFRKVLFFLGLHKTHERLKRKVFIHFMFVQHTFPTLH